MRDLFQALTTCTASLSTWKIILILCVFGLFVYGNTFNNQLFWDDFESIVHNEYIKDWSNFDKFFSQNLTAGSGILDNYWRPLLLTSFAIDHTIAGLSPWMYHLQSLLWHIGSSVLIFSIIRRYLKNDLFSLLGALIFLVHPLQTEAVTYVAGRADPMHSAFMLGALLSFMLFWKKPLEKRFYIFSLFLFICALLVKERALIFPGIILLHLFLMTDEGLFSQWKKKLLYWSPFLLLAILYIILRSTALHFTDTFDIGQPNNTGAEGLYDSLLLYFKGMAIYAGLLIWPAKLYMEKSIAIPNSIFSPSVIIGIIIFLSSLWYSLKNIQKYPVIAFGVFWFYGALSPSLHIFPIQGLLYEHWLYFPLIGPLLILLFFLSRTTVKNRKLLIGLLILAILLLGFRSILRNNDWQEPIRFYEKNVSLGGYSGRIYTNLGMAYHEAEDHNKALLNYNKALELQPILFQPHYNKGNLYREINDIENAERSYRAAIQNNPYFMSSYSNLAGLYANEKRYDDAISILQEALTVQDTNVQTLYNLAILYAQNGDTISARRYFNKILEIDPSNTAIVNLINSL